MPIIIAVLLLLGMANYKNDSFFHQIDTIGSWVVGILIFTLICALIFDKEGK